MCVFADNSRLHGVNLPRNALNLPILVVKYSNNFSFSRYRDSCFAYKCVNDTNTCNPLVTLIRKWAKRSKATLKS